MTSVVHVRIYWQAPLLFLAGWSPWPTRWAARSAGRTFKPTRWSTRPTRWAFGAPAESFFVGQFSRFLSGCPRALLCSALRTEVGCFIGQLCAAVGAKPFFFKLFIGWLHGIQVVCRFHRIWIICGLHEVRVVCGLGAVRVVGTLQAIWIIRPLYEIRIICRLQSAIFPLGHLETLPFAA